MKTCKLCSSRGPWKERHILVSHLAFAAEEGVWWGRGAYIENHLPVQKKLYVAKRGPCGRTDVYLFDLTELHHKTVFMH